MCFGFDVEGLKQVGLCILFSRAAFVIVTATTALAFPWIRG